MIADADRLVVIIIKIFDLANSSPTTSRSVSESRFLCYLGCIVYFRNRTGFGGAKRFSSTQNSGHWESLK